MSVLDIVINSLDGSASTVGQLTAGRPALLVNVASRCGFTPQYGVLEELHKTYSPRGFTVLGIPCNQFGGQEPGSPDEIAQFCSATYGVTFPMTEKVEVNGPRRHPLYEALTAVADDDGRTGDIQWNFEKFLLDGEGKVVGRWGPQVSPADERVLERIQEAVGSDE